jgi:predicted outer membrane protein
MGRRTKTARLSQRSIVMMAGAAAALVLALIAALVIQENLGFGGKKVAVSERAGSKPAPSATHSSGHQGGKQGAAQPADPNAKPGTPPGASGSAPGDAQPNIDTGAALTSGRLSALDRELLIKVRQANLWELPAGRLAQTNAGSESVRRAGLHLIDGHARLDGIVVEISKALGIEIPDQASADQQAWVRQLENSKGEEFDRFFANQLRNAHGKVFVLVAQVRSTTQNSVIRDLAIEANIAVSDHLQVLEDTGLVEERTFTDVAGAVIKP